LKSFTQRTCPAFKRQMLTAVQSANFATKSHFYQILQLDETREGLRSEVERFATAECAPR